MAAGSSMLSRKTSRSITGTRARRAAAVPTDRELVSESRNSNPRSFSTAITAVIPSTSAVNRLPMWLLMPT